MAFWNKKKKNINDKASLDGRKYNLEEQRYKQDTKARKLLAIWVVLVDTAWLAFTAYIVRNQVVLGVSDVVLCSLLGTATATVLGLGYIVLKGLYINETNK